MAKQKPLATFRGDTLSNLSRKLHHLMMERNPTYRHAVLKSDEEKRAAAKEAVAAKEAKQ